MTTFTQKRYSSRVTLTISKRSGSFEGMPTERKWTVQFLGITALPENIKVNNKLIDSSEFTYDEATGTLTVTVSTDNLSQSITISVPLSEMA